MDGWNTSFLLGQRAYFQVQTVSSREGNQISTLFIFPTLPPRTKKENKRQNGLQMCWTQVFHSIKANARDTSKKTQSFEVWNYPSSQKMVIPAVPETNIAPESGWLEYDRFLLGWPIFRGELLVSRGVPQKQNGKWCHHHFGILGRFLVRAMYLNLWEA